MTQPLPNPTAKSAPADAASRLELGNFFQPAGPRQGSADFDSFLPKEDWKDRADQAEEAEEQRRKKKAAAEQACADPATTRSNNPLLDSKPDAESLPAKLTQTTDSETPQADNSKASANENTENVEEEAAEDSSQITADGKSAVADGMEVAPLDAEMISLATFEDTATAPVLPLRDPLVTTSNRLTVSAALSERSAITALSASSTDGGNSQSLQGNPNPATPQPAAASKSEPQPAASILKNFAAELEKFRQSGQSQVQLELNVGENETVKVRLQMRADELRSTFITDSPELRDALQKAWPEFAQSSRDRGFQFGNPSFQDAYSQNYPQNNSPSQNRQDARNRDSNSEFAIPVKSIPAPRRAATPAAARPALWA